MKILVTGGCGFIGSHLVTELVKQGASVEIVDDLSTGSISNLPEDVASKVKIIKKSVKDAFEYTSFTKEVADDYDRIYHLAAVVGVKRVLDLPLETLVDNPMETMLILDHAINQTKKPVIFIASTSEVYGKNDKWSLQEDDDRVTGSTQKIRWVYSESKAIDEFLAQIYAKKFGLQIMVGRFFNVVGPRQCSMYGMVLPRFVEQALSGADITVYDDGTQIRSFMHVNDCVACVLGVTNVASIFANGCTVVNIGNDDPIMIKDLAWRIRRQLNSSSKIKYISYGEAYGENSGFEDMMRRVPNIERLKLLLGQEEMAFRDIETIIADTAKELSKS